MAHVILGGLLTSSFLTLVVVPGVVTRFVWEADEAFARAQQSPFEDPAPTPER